MNHVRTGAYRAHLNGTATVTDQRPVCFKGSSQDNYRFSIPWLVASCRYCWYFSCCEANSADLPPLASINLKIKRPNAPRVPETESRYGVDRVVEIVFKFKFQLAKGALWLPLSVVVPLQEFVF